LGISGNHVDLPILIGIRSGFRVFRDADQDDRASVTTLSVWAEGRHVENFQYSLAGTPCENVIGTSTCCVPSGVQNEYPEDILLQQMGCEAYVGVSVADPAGASLGLIALMFKRSITLPPGMEDTIREFSLRTAAELVRVRAEEQINDDEREELAQTTALRPVLVYSGNQLLSVNDAACALFGVDSCDRLVGQSLDAAFPGFEFSSLSDIQVGERCTLRIMTGSEEREVDARIYPVMYQGRKSGMIVLSS
jgi:PAS domain-containing protein